MNKHTVVVAGFTERGESRFPTAPAKTIGGIIVRPPIHAGEHFKRVVLGKDAYGVNLHEVATTDEATLFLAESARPTSEARRIDIDLIAMRIGEIVNAPETVIKMLDQNPFPDTRESM